MPTSFYITGNRGISSFTPGNFTGNPNVGGGAAASTSAAAGMTIRVGSGADEAGAPVPPTPVSRFNFGYGGSNAPIMAYIGQTSGGSNSPVLPPGESYRAPTAPVPALPPLGLAIPGTPVGPSNNSLTQPANPLNRPIGQPALGPSIGPRLGSPTPAGGMMGGAGPMLPDPNH
jgi:hypothetical protein